MQRPTILYARPFLPNFEAPCQGQTGPESGDEEWNVVVPSHHFINCVHREEGERKEFFFRALQLLLKK